MSIESGLFNDNSKDEKPSEFGDTFEFNEETVVTPKEGDLVLCDEQEGEDEWAFFPFKNQLKRDFKTAFLFNSDEDEKFIKQFIGLLGRNYPSLKPCVFKIDMKAYEYWKEDPEFSDVVFIKVTPEIIHEKWKLDSFGPLNFGKEEI